MGEFALSFGTVFGAFIKLLALLTPTAVMSAFIVCTGCLSRREQQLVACKTGLAIYVTGQLLFWFGPQIFSLFGFTLDAFRIGVGLLLFLEAIDLLNGDEQKPPPYCGDISVVPLAIPLGMGPATIGAVMVMGAQAHGAQAHMAGSLALFLAAFAVTMFLCLARQIQKVLGHTGIQIMAKLTALLLSALAAQVIFTGVKSFIQR